MNKLNNNPKKNHHGRNLKRLREMLGVKQEALAIQLGPKWSQKKVSTLERKEFMNANLSAVIAKILGGSVGIIEKFTEEFAMSNLNTCQEGHSNHSMSSSNCCNFIPLDTLMEVVEENRKLYERLLISESGKG